MSLVQASLARGILVANGTPSRTFEPAVPTEMSFAEDRRREGQLHDRGAAMLPVSFRQSSISQATVEFRGSGVCLQ